MNLIFKNLRVGADTNKQIAQKLSDQITWLIASGQIKADQKLPAVRELADYLYDICVLFLFKLYQKDEWRSLTCLSNVCC